MEEVLKLVFRDPVTTMLILVLAVLPLGVSVLFIAYWTFEKICDTAVCLLHGHPPAPVCSCDTDEDDEEGDEEDDNPHAPKGFAKP